MKEDVKESLRVYLTSVAASVSSLYLFNEFIKPSTSPTSPVSKSMKWKPLSNEEIHQIRLLIDNR